MFEIRLGDIIDDYCVKCRRLTNHAVVSIIDGAAAKVRCRTCYHDHDYRHEQAPPSKKDLKKAELFNEVLAGAAGGGETATPAAALTGAAGGGETAAPAAAAPATEPPAVEEEKKKGGRKAVKK